MGILILKVFIMDVSILSVSIIDVSIMRVSALGSNTHSTHTHSGYVHIAHCAHYGCVCGVPERELLQALRTLRDKIGALVEQLAAQTRTRG